EPATAVASDLARAESQSACLFELENDALRQPKSSSGFGLDATPFHSSEKSRPELRRAPEYNHLGDAPLLHHRPQELRGNRCTAAGGIAPQDRRRCARGCGLHPTPRERPLAARCGTLGM